MILNNHVKLNRFHSGSRTSLSLFCGDIVAYVSLTGVACCIRGLVAVSNPIRTEEECDRAGMGSRRAMHQILLAKCNVRP